MGLAYDYLAEATLMDLDDLGHNFRDGLRVASLAGTWVALVAGLAGMRDRGGNLSFSPCLPEGITRLAIALSVRHRRMRRRSHHRCHDLPALGRRTDSGPKMGGSSGKVAGG